MLTIKIVLHRVELGIPCLSMSVTGKMGITSPPSCDPSNHSLVPENSMKSFGKIVTLASALTALPVFAESICPDAITAFSAATQIYVKQGNEAFIQYFGKDDPLADDKKTLGQAQGLQQIEQAFGSLQSSTVLSTKELGPRTCYLVGVLEYEKGPAFARITYYRGTKGINATSWFFKTEPETFLPIPLLIK